jgi:hypothetical protein
MRTGEERDLGKRIRQGVRELSGLRLKDDEVEMIGVLCKGCM